MALFNVPNASRNALPIIELLRGILPERGLVLELASGAGEHVCAFAEAFPRLTFQPSDLDRTHQNKIQSLMSNLTSKNILPPLCIDTTAQHWPISHADAVICINMIHIAPFEACEGLMRGAANIIAPGGYLYLYGAYKIDGQHTAPSNEAFDRALRSSNPAWGVRDLEVVKDAAQRHGLSFVKCVDMPSNNFSVIFQQAQGMRASTGPEPKQSSSETKHRS
eukprot:jgi/Botrbrau1/2804/Bobra.0125s0015.1